MLLCFVDESFRGDFYGFAAVMADELATRDLTERFNAIMHQVSIDYGVPADTEVHGYPLFHGKERWSATGARARVSIHEQIVGAIAGADVTLLMRAVDSKALRKRQEREHYRTNFPPEQVCFQHILQRANAVAGRRNTYALTIADERGDRERHRERFATYQTEGTPGVYMHTRLDRLLDTVHFAPSVRSRMLQAADIVAFTFQRRQTVTERDVRAQVVMDRIWRKVSESGKVYSIGSWP